MDIGLAPYLSGEAAHIAYNRVDIKEISSHEGPKAPAAAGFTMRR